MSFLELSNEIAATIVQTLNIDENDAHYTDTVDMYAEWVSELMSITSEADLNVQRYLICTIFKKLIIRSAFSYLISLNNNDPSNPEIH